MPRDNEPGQGKRKGTTSGSGKTSRYAPQAPTKPARWADVDSGYIQDALDALQSAGDALLLGASRDGSVLVATVCSGDERVKFYAKSPQEMDKHLVDIKEAAQGLAGK